MRANTISQSSRLAVSTAIAGLGGAAIVVGSFLTWLNEQGARPKMSINHTSLSHMLVFNFDHTSFLKSVGFAVIVLGTLMIVGALVKLRLLVFITALLTIAASGMWIGVVVHHYNSPTLPNIHYVNPANVPWSNLRSGAWLTLAGAVLGLVSVFLPSRRVKRTQ